MTTFEELAYWQVVINGAEENIKKAKTPEEKEHLTRFRDYYKKIFDTTKNKLNRKGGE